MIEELENIEKLENKDSVATTESAEVTESVEVLKKDSNKKWYVLRVMGGKEKKTVAFIEKEIDRLKMQDHVSKILVDFKINDGKFPDWSLHISLIQ